MYLPCLNCGHDMGNQVGYDTLGSDYIVCPECGAKMTIGYEEIVSDDWEEDRCWWLERYVEKGKEPKND